MTAISHFIFMYLCRALNSLRMCIHMYHTMVFTVKLFIRPKKYICVFTATFQQNLGSVGWDYYFFFFYYRQNRKQLFPVPESDSGISISIFPVKWRIMQFFYLLCSQFRQKASSWINKTLLLVKQQKWLSEFCVKIHRVASKN
jgi:hypothetical protein